MLPLTPIWGSNLIMSSPYDQNSTECSINKIIDDLNELLNDIIQNIFPSKSNIQNLFHDSQLHAIGE